MRKEISSGSKRTDLSLNQTGGVNWCSDVGSIIMEELTRPLVRNYAPADRQKAFVFGVLNEYSIGYHISQKSHEEGCELAFSHLPGEKIERRVVPGGGEVRAEVLCPAT